ncbi:MAG: helix-turn-helix transcriptional regulator [Paludibacteraceae bacterium]|jgi:transcriptional regulator with XRE-family HTH domain|nr:helix-turn-helix transcriptional regulator [Paludibacteraceae bacterium]
MSTVVGKNLKQLRDFNRFSQEQVSQFLKINRSTYANYESGEREAPLEVLENVSNLYGCDLYLLFEEDVVSFSDMLLCTFRVDNLNQDDMEEIANFKDIVKSYLKMKRLQEA